MVTLGSAASRCADGPFEERAGHRRAAQGRRRAAGDAAALVPVHVGGEVDLHGAAGVELIDDSGEPAFEESSAARRAAGGDGGPGALGCATSGRRGRVVAVDDGDLVEAVGQHAGRAEPGHAGADHDDRDVPRVGVVTRLGGHDQTRLVRGVTNTALPGSPGASCTTTSSKPASASMRQATCSPQAVPRPAPPRRVTR